MIAVQFSRVLSVNQSKLYLLHLWKTQGELEKYTPIKTKGGPILREVQNLLRGTRPNEYL